MQVIVEHLNAPPFDKNLLLFDLDMMDAAQLVQLLSDVLRHVDERLDVSAVPGGAEAYGEVAGTFLVKALRFRVPDPHALVEQLQAGDKAAVFAALAHVLPKLPQMKRRAYLARFLLPVEIPGEFAMEPELQAHLLELQRAQEAFKGLHKQADALRQDARLARVPQLRQDTATLAKEKSQLESRIRARQDEMRPMPPALEELLGVLRKLRLAQERSQALAARRIEQVDALEQTERRFAEAEAQRAKVARRKGASPSELFANLERELEAQLRLRDGVDRELSAARERERAVVEQLYEPAKSAEDVARKEETVSALSAALEDVNAQLSDKLDASGSTQLVAFHRQMTGVRRRLHELEDERRGLLQRRATLERQVSAAAPKDARTSGVTKVQLESVAARSREKLPRYKELRAEEARLNRETVVLQRSVHILGAKCPEHAQRIAETARKRAMESRAAALGGREAADGDEQDMDLLAGDVQRLEVAIMETREALKPGAERLRLLRQEHSKVASAHQEARQAYDSVAVSHELRIRDAEASSRGLEAECLRDEQAYFTILHEKSIAEAELARVRQEERWREGHGRLLPDFVTFVDLYENKLGQQEAFLKELRRRRKELQDIEGPATEQRAHFASLHELLQCKQSSARPPSGERAL